MIWIRKYLFLPCWCRCICAIERLIETFIYRTRRLCLLSVIHFSATLFSCPFLLADQQLLVGVSSVHTIIESPFPAVPSIRLSCSQSLLWLLLPAVNKPTAVRLTMLRLCLSTARCALPGQGKKWAVAWTSTKTWAASLALTSTHRDATQMYPISRRHRGRGKLAPKERGFSTYY